MLQRVRKISNFLSLHVFNIVEGLFKVGKIHNEWCFKDDNQAFDKLYELRKKLFCKKQPVLNVVQQPIFFPKGHASSSAEVEDGKIPGEL